MSNLIQILLFILGLLLILIGTLIYAVFPMMAGGPVVAAIGLIAVIVYVALNYKEIMKSVSVRSAKYGTNTFVFVTVIFFIILCIYNLGSGIRYKIDTTMFKDNSLSEQSIKIAQNIKKPVEIFGFVQKKDIGARDLFRKRCDLYKYHSNGKIFCRLIDPDVQPAMARRFSVTNANEKIYGFQSGKKLSKTRFLTEEDFTSSLIKVSQETKKYIYFTNGHGEGNIKSDDDFEFRKLITKLEDNNYSIREIFLPKEYAIPEECSVLIVLAPKSNFMETEISKIDSYLNKGGSVLFLVDPLEETGLENFLERWGLILRDDIVVDTVSNINKNPTVLLVNRYRPHPITTVSRGQLQQTFFSEARSITKTQKTPKDINQPQILFFTPGGYKYSFSESDTKKYEKEGLLQFEPPKDLRGPLALGWVVTKNIEEDDNQEETEQKALAEQKEQKKPDKKGKKKDKAKKAKPTSTLEKEAKKEKRSRKKPEQGKLVIFGDSDFVSNKYLEFYGNLDLVLNTINWLAGDDNLISVDRAVTKPNLIRLTRPTRSLIYYVYLALVPFVIFLTGFVIWWKKRK